ncbi:ATP-binding protein [Vibrio viridaestus]|uniref:histidine kinase n=1 Tax=Vibrio viridaestus TaxID=2487322 RepID=A0A3N9TAA1_9VIBR|nr:ATP-binding protein [Vibrio viridaestus]RQW61077.1 response regulator [Vibrio viridaestus]
MTRVFGWGAFFVSLLLSIYVTYLYSQYSTNEILSKTHSTLESETAEKVRLFQSEIAHDIDAIKFLHSTPPISGITRALASGGIDPDDNTSLTQWKARLSVIFKSFIENNADVRQLRLISVQDDGDEFLRVDRNGGRVVVMPQVRLQNKKEEPYYQYAKALAPDEVLVGAINLNREHGKIVYPLQPTFRVSMPIFYESGQRFGFLIINFDASELLSGLSQKDDLIDGVWLIDEHGHFIINSSDDIEFTEQLAPDITLNSQYRTMPATMSKMILLQHKQHADEVWYATQRAFTLGTNVDQKLHLIGVISKGKVDEVINGRRYEIAFFAGISILVIVVFVGVFYRSYAASMKLNKANSTFQAIVDSASDAVIGIKSNGKISTWNNAATQMLGVPYFSAVNQLLVEVLYLENENLGLKIKEVQKSKSSFTFKDSISSKGDVLIHVELRISPVLTASLRMLESYVITIRDVTSDVLAEAQLKQHNQELEQKVSERTHELKRHAEELEVAHKRAMEASQAKSNFISTISHEMRTPLNGMVGTLSLVRNESITAAQDKYLTMAENSVNTLAVLINDILDLSKIESGKLEVHHQRFSPKDVIEIMVQSCSVKAHEKNLAVEVDTTGISYQTVTSDPNRLKQIINNLLNNATKFTNDGAIRVVAATQLIEETTVRLNVDVFDTGIGIAQENQHRLFQPFSQEASDTATKFGGTGLGLSISRQLCELLHGSIGFESKQGEGSHFYFYIDMSSEGCELSTQNRVLDSKRVGIAVHSDTLDVSLSRMIEDWGGQAVSLLKPDIELITQLNALIIEEDYLHYETLMQLGQSTPQLNIIKLSSDTHLPPHTIDYRDGEVTILSQPIISSDLLNTLLGKTNFKAERNVKQDSITKQGNADFSGIRILVVDDNEINREVARGFLETWGADVFSANDGKQALEIIEANADAGSPFDCILMDCQMPIMDGYQCAKELRFNHSRYHTASVPIIAMTANAFSGEKEKCLAHGMSDYITKPVDSNILCEKLLRWTKSKRHSKQKLEAPMNNELRESQYAGWDRDSALKRMNGNEALFAKIVSIFEASSADYMNKLESVISEHDVEAIAQWSHKLKGLCGDIGGTTLREIMSEIETEARRGDACQDDIINAKYIEAKQEYAHLMTEIAKGK